MAVQDDLRRLSQMDSIFLGWSASSSNPAPLPPGGSITSWYKGRVQQAADGSWIFRSISQDGSVVGYQLGSPLPSWSSDEQPSTGIRVFIPVTQVIPALGTTFNLATVSLQQQLPQELTN
jgi:hypothetical protein